MTRLELVCGPPCSGKTTYVAERQVRGDLIVDVDVLASALAGRPLYDKPAEVLPFVYEARDAVLRRLARKHDVRTVWLIAGAPTRMQRAELVRLAGPYVTPVLRLLLVSADECKARVRQARPSDRWAEWDTAIDRWWHVYDADPVFDRVEATAGCDRERRFLRGTHG